MIKGLCVCEGVLERERRDRDMELELLLEILETMSCKAHRALEALVTDFGSGTCPVNSLSGLSGFLACSGFVRQRELWL